VRGLAISDDDMMALTTINYDEWRAEMDAVGVYLGSYGERLPLRLREEQQRIAKELE